jgi:hypothetical protein
MNIAGMETISWISKGTTTNSGTLHYTVAQQAMEPSDLVVSILSQGRRSTGILFPSKTDNNIYLIQTYHSCTGDITPRVLVYNLNGVRGKHVIVPFTIIGVERTSDIAVGICTLSSMLDFQYYHNLVKWDAANDDALDGECVLVVGDSDLHGPHLKSLGVIKRRLFFGSGNNVFVKSTLIDNVPCTEGGSGSAVFFNRRGIPHFVGMVNSSLTSADGKSVTIAIHNDVVLHIVRKAIINWNASNNGSLSNINYFTVSNTIKRSVTKAFLGVLHEYVTLDTLTTFPSLAALTTSTDASYSYGGVLITAFVRGFDKNTGDFLTDIVTYVEPNQVLVHSAIQASQMYATYSTNQLPVLLTSVRYKKWNSFDYQVDILGQNPGQVGLGEYEIYGDPSSPVTLYYYVYNNSTWQFQEETLVPTSVTYTDEDMGTVEQSDLAYPYPLYGLEQVGSAQYLMAVSKFSAIVLPPTSSTSDINKQTFYFSAFTNPSWKSHIMGKGGKVVSNITSSLSYVIGTASDVKSLKTADMKKAIALKIPIVDQKTARSRFGLT